MSSTNNLKDVLKPKTSKNTSSKNPAFYNAEKTKLISDLASNPNADVRQAIASNEHTPTKILVAMLETEQDREVLREVIMNSKMPRKAVAKFIEDDNDVRVDYFSDDKEMIEHFTK